MWGERKAGDEGGEQILEISCEGPLVVGHAQDFRGRLMHSAIVPVRGRHWWYRRTGPRFLILEMDTAGPPW